ncbi:MAG: glycosyl hydrolase family 18 protein [Gammaproteobacteria bacterium]|nr:glycosyl hydrolase family 18 protein [Gammaproteobacteria bacterium]
MKKIIKCLLLSYSLFISSLAYAQEIVGYIYRSDSILHLINDDIIQQNASMKAHIKSMTIIAPQAYQVNEKGIVWGAVDPLMMNLTKRNHVKVMPLVTNADFDSARTHLFLTNTDAQVRAISSILEICKTNGFAGIQVDFEHILFTDRNNFSRFYENLARALHKEGFQVSVAIFPRLSDVIPKSERARSSMEHWSGGYDYSSLGKASDFVTLMAYAQHGTGTTPGSACEPAWVEQIVKYALQFIPADKISLGLPVYSAYWYTISGHRETHVNETDLTYVQLQYVLEKFHISLQWDPIKKLSYAVFVNNGLNEYIFAENVPTFKIKMNLVNKYHLRGSSLWHLGTEDPGIWKIV